MKERIVVNVVNDKRRIIMMNIKERVNVESLPDGGSGGSGGGVSMRRIVVVE